MPRFAWLTVTILSALLLQTAHAYKPDATLMQIKGYSPETVEITTTQTYRQEWRYPPPPLRSPRQQIWRNIYNNDWLGNVDPFGSYKIREKQ